MTIEKSSETERDQSTEGEPPTPSRAMDELIKDEEQNGKQRKTKRNKQGAGPKPTTLYY